jgi:hypothetical protein
VNAAVDVFRELKLQPSEMRYELGDYEWEGQSDAAEQAARRAACK